MNKRIYEHAMLSMNISADQAGMMRLGALTDRHHVISMTSARVIEVYHASRSVHGAKGVQSIAAQSRRLVYWNH